MTLLSLGIGTQRGLFGLDMPMHDLAIEIRHPLLTWVMFAVTYLLGPEVVIPTTIIIAALWMWRKKEYWRPGLFALSIGGAFIVSALLKTLIGRARPPVADMIPPIETGLSFPSNHVLGVAALVFVLGYLVYSRRRNDRSMLLWIASSVTCIELIAFSRIYLGYHWLTDVTASVGLALVILAIVIVIDTYYSERINQRAATKAVT